ncbi:uncharacterized protein LOC110860437 isoform X2 [Folsomia candida]|uniref:uncharacterized protein LOC110860437 isoform X2 n=1 Tax=Folsomia candida TaxID=158441 RepID=UPI000B90991B|nr:uncharacterized protein LOC110860437 isoform X2 [Folsomia candida]
MGIQDSERPSVKDANPGIKLDKVAWTKSNKYSRHFIHGQNRRKHGNRANQDRHEFKDIEDMRNEMNFGTRFSRLFMLRMLCIAKPER